MLKREATLGSASQACLVLDDAHEKQKLTREPRARPDYDDPAWERIQPNKEALRDVESSKAIDVRNRFQVP